MIDPERSFESKDAPHIEIPSDDEEIEQSFLSRYFDDQQFPWSDNANQTEAVALQEDGSLSFSQAEVDQRAAKLMEAFLTELEGFLDGSSDLVSPISWYFSAEPREFLEALKEHLEVKLGKRPVEDQDLKKLDVSVKAQLEKAAGLFKDLAKRELIKRAFQEQIPYIPLSVIILRDKVSGIEQTVPFKIDPNYVHASSYGLDFIYVNNSFGQQPELLIASQNPNYEIAGFSTIGQDAQDFIAAGKYIIPEQPKKNVDSSPGDGHDSTNYEFQVLQGGAPQAPIFKTVRIFTQPINFGEQIDNLIKEREERDALARKQQAAAQAPTPQYFGTPPTAASTPQTPVPRYEQPKTSYVRSG